MSMFMYLTSLFASVVQPAKPTYTTVIYPTQGKAVVVHDGLGIRHERPWYQLFDSLLEEGDVHHAATSNRHEEHLAWSDSVEPIQADDFPSSFSANGLEPMKTQWVNPATGLPMLDGCIDAMGNPYGMDMLSDSLGFDSNDFGGSFSSFGFD